MPLLSPSASATAAPRTMPTSSTVWWASISRSPSARIVEIHEPVTRDLVQHVLEERDAGGDVARAGTVKVDGYLDPGLDGARA